MKRVLFIIFALPIFITASAQLEREVEVTKQYVPKLPPARKMDMIPDMVDTVAIRPEIDYTISPKSFDSALTSEKFRPATVTYWEYVKHYPFYIKAGAGYPLVTELDAYASTNRADVGYLSVYINHRGSFSDIKVDNPFTAEQYCTNSKQMSNRIGFNGGKYIGRYTLNGDIFYSSDAFHRYAQPAATEEGADVIDEINYEDIGVKLNFGDSFSDMKRLNFNIYATANYYNDKSDQWQQPAYGLLTGDSSSVELPSTGEPIAVDRKVQQLDMSLGLLFGRNVGNRSVIKAALEYQGYYGMKFTKNYSNTLIGGYVAYEYHHTKLFDIKAKVGYMFDNIPSEGGKARHHFLPELYAGFNVKDNGTFVPYVEVDSKLSNNSYKHLQQINPYIMLYSNEYAATPNSLTYNMRAGFAGHTLNNMFAYRLYANAAFITDALYWYNVSNIGFDFKTARQNVYSLAVSLEYKPLSSLYIGVGLQGFIYKDFIEEDIQNGKPNFKGNLGIRYTHRKFAVGATAELIGARSWSFIGQQAEGIDQYTMQSHTYPACVDLGISFDWFVSKQCTIYIEGRNLANAKIYDWALYRRLGVGGLAGIKVQF